MKAVCERLLGRLVLWHGTSQENADAIYKEGFRPSPRSSQHNFRQATWFYHVTSFTGETTGVGAHLILAVDVNSYERGRDFIHEMDDTVVFQVPIPADALIARLDSPREALPEALNILWKCDVISEFTECCCNRAIPWSQKCNVAEMLWSMAPGRYFDTGVPHHLLMAEVPGLSLNESVHLVWLLRENAPKFLNGWLRLYHRVFLTPRLGRAIMAAAARYIAPAHVLALADGTRIPTPSSQERAAVMDFAGAVLPRLPSNALIRGAMEMASMRHFPGSEDDIHTISAWVVRRAVEGDESEAEETAFHYVMFGGDTYPSRHSRNVARDIAAHILQTIGEDYFERFLALGDTNCHQTLDGVMHAFATFRDERAIPFIAKRLNDSRKMQRVAAINALGEIGTPTALSAIGTVANDKRKVVRNAVQRALGSEPSSAARTSR